MRLEAGTPASYGFAFKNINPFTLSPSTSLRTGFDKLSPNGSW
jgi:hypothetical protein